MGTDPIETAKNGASLIGEVIKAVGDDPKAKEAAHHLGSAVVTVTKTLNNILLPLAAINFAFDKAKQYFSGKFEEDIGAHTKDIPADQIIEPKASVAGPTLQGLAFTHEEQDLKEMYLNLLATAMDRRVARSAHPAFVEIIKQLDAQEARLLRGALQSKNPIPIVQIHLSREGVKGYNMLETHLLNLRDPKTGGPVIDTHLPAMIDNWVRLGLVEVSYDKHLTDDSQYEWADARPEIIKYRAAEGVESKNVTFQKGILHRTELGRDFAKVVGL